MAQGIQQQVGVQPAPAFVGDYADGNPRAFVTAGPGGLVAGSLGVTVGRFAWLSQQYIDQDNSATVVNSFGIGSPAGIVTRRQQGLITTYLAASGLVVPTGFPIELLSEGGLWVKNEGAAQALAGMNVYANFTNGAISFAAASSASTISATGSSVAAGTSSFTGSITGNQLTVTSVSSGTIYPGTTITGTGIAAGTIVMAQISGTIGGVGVYAVNIPEQTVASTSVSGTYGILTVGTTAATTWGAGQVISGTGVVAGTQITAAISGTGGAGTYVVNNNTVVASTTITAAVNIQTKFVAMSAGNVGELVKITSHLQG